MGDHGVGVVGSVVNPHPKGTRMAIASGAFVGFIVATESVTHSFLLTTRIRQVLLKYMRLGVAVKVRPQLHAHALVTFGRGLYVRMLKLGERRRWYVPLHDT